MTVKQNQKQVSRDIQLKRSMLNLKQKTAVKRQAKWLFPHQSELFYKEQLAKIVDLIDQSMKNLLIPLLPRLQAEIDGNRPTATNDAFLDDLTATLNNMQTFVNSNQDDPTLLASTVGSDVSQYNRGQMTKVLKSAFGVSVTQSEPWLTTQLDLFTSQNVDLIKNITTKAMSDIQGIVTRGFAQGTSLREMQASLEDRIGFTRNRAKLIARDQTSKLNGQLTQLRQNQNGISKYVWVTAGDERVRPTHAANEGRTFSWDDPPATGNPGDDYNCRCIASPVLEGLL